MGILGLRLRFIRKDNGYTNAALAKNRARKEGMMRAGSQTCAWDVNMDTPMYVKMNVSDSRFRMSKN